MRALGLDYGDRRIGVAISDEIGLAAHGVRYINRKNLDQDLVEIQKILTEYGNVSVIVVGMPYNMDGSEGDRVVLTRQFMVHLKARFQLPLAEIDERWSSMEAEKFLIGADVSRRKRRGKVDQLAASFILQTYLEQNRR